MQARIVPAARGAQWLLDGVRLFAAAPIGWLAAVFAYWVVMTLVSLLPAGGAAIAPLLVPAFSVGFMSVARAAERGARVELPQLFEGFRRAPTPQLVLGAIYVGCLAAVLAGAALADGGAFARLMLSGARPEDEAQAAELRNGLAAATLLYLPVMMLFWFAPVLAAWHAAGIAKALFFSFAACLINWRAFILYGAVAVVLPSLALYALLQGFGDAVRPQLLLMPLLFVVLPVLLASFYASYRDVFGEPA